MKKLFLILISLTFLFGCKTPQDTVKNNDGEIELPFAGTEYQSNKDDFRAVQSGKSPDLTTAKKMALHNAKAELATNMEAVIKAVTDNYTNQRTVSDRQNFESKFEQISREVTKQSLIDVRVIGEKAFEKDGKYTFWVAIEMSKTQILNKMEDKITNDEKLRLDFDKHKFEQLLEKEMEEFDKNKN